MTISFSISNRQGNIVNNSQCSLFAFNSRHYIERLLDILSLLFDISPLTAYFVTLTFNGQSDNKSWTSLQASE
jgi:hypothetical protein